MSWSTCKRGEQTTLARVHQHCIEHPDPPWYIHNKGSTHNSRPNTWLRHVHMRASACLSQLQQGGNAAQCNVCSARFAVASLSHLWKYVGSALQLCEGAAVQTGWKALWREFGLTGALWPSRNPREADRTRADLDGRAETLLLRALGALHPAVTPCDVPSRQAVRFAGATEAFPRTMAGSRRSRTLLASEEEFYVHGGKEMFHDIQSHCEGRAGEHTQPEDDLPCDHEWSILYPSKPAQAAWIAPYFMAGVLPSSSTCFQDWWRPPNPIGGLNMSRSGRGKTKRHPEFQQV